jgi:hypothetical protein
MSLSAMETSVNPDHTRVIKKSFRHLVTDELLVRTVDKFVIWNSKIAIRGAMIMNYLMAKSIEEEIELPQINQKFLYQAFNWGHPNAISECSPEIKERIPDPVGVDSDGRVMEGKPWLIDYLIIQYMGNIKSSITNMYKSIIKSSVIGHIKAYHPNASKNAASSLNTNLTRCIRRPMSETTKEYARLDPNSKEFVEFHRNGFGAGEDDYINDIFIKAPESRSPDGITRIVTHFGKCLQRQENLAGNFVHCANRLKGQNALPMHDMGSRMSIFICKKGLHYILKQHMKDIGSNGDGWETMDEDEDDEDYDDEMAVVDEETWRQRLRTLVCSYSSKTTNMSIQSYKKWITSLFDVGKNGNLKEFPDPPTCGKCFEHWGGVKISTDGVTASVYYVEREVNAATSLLNGIPLMKEKKEMKREEPDDKKQTNISLLVPKKSKSLLVLVYIILGSMSRSTFY